VTPARSVAAMEDTTSSPCSADRTGVKGQLASNTAASGLGPWHLARSKALSVGLNNNYFRLLGFPSLFGMC
jgi:hypothetical protein